MVKAAVQGPFRESTERILDSTGLRVPKRSLEQMLQQAAQDFDAFYLQRLPEADPPAASILVVAVDGTHANADVYVIDMCPQANVTETFLGGFEHSPNAIKTLMKKKPRATISGYLEARLNSPFLMIPDVSHYITPVAPTNSKIPRNIHLIAGDSLLEIQAEALGGHPNLAIDGHLKTGQRRKHSGH